MMGEKQRLRETVLVQQQQIAEMEALAAYWKKLAASRMERIIRIRDVACAGSNGSGDLQEMARMVTTPRPYSAAEIPMGQRLHDDR